MRDWRALLLRDGAGQEDGRERIELHLWWMMGVGRRWDLGLIDDFMNVEYALWFSMGVRFNLHLAATKAKHKPRVFALNLLAGACFVRQLVEVKGTATLWICLQLTVCDDTRD